MRNKFLIILFIFILTLVVKSNENMYFTFQSVQDLLIPYNTLTNRINFILFALNLGLVMLFMFNLISKIDKIFSMQIFIVSRGGKLELHKTLVLTMIKEVSFLGAAQLFVMVLFSLRNFTEVFINLICFNLSILLTLFIWTSLITSFKLIYFKTNTALFLMISIILIAQALSNNIWFFSVFIFSSIHFYDGYLAILLSKVMLFSLIMFLNTLLLKKYELIGD